MQSSNPVFSRAQGFNGRGSASGMTYPGQGAPQAPQYAPPGYPTQQPSYGGPQAPSGYDQQTGYDRMTIDSVVQKTGISIGLVVLAAAATWFLTGPLDSPGAQLALLGKIRAQALGQRGAIWRSFKRPVEQRGNAMDLDRPARRRPIVGIPAGCRRRDHVGPWLCQPANRGGAALGQVCRAIP